MKTFDAIQALRAVAALMVVAFHVFSRAPGLGHPGYAMEWGAAGVDVFFVISGFIIYVSQFEARGGAGRFLENRLLRIAPLYWLVTIGLIALHVAIGLGRDLELTPSHIVQSLLFIPHFDPADPATIQPVLIQGWTLQYELAFYALFALALGLEPRRRLAVVGGVLVALVALGVWLRPAGAIGTTVTDPRLLEFVLGMLLGAAAKSAPHRLPLWLAALVPLGLLTMAGAEHLAINDLWVWIPAAGCIVAGAVALDLSRRARMPRFVLLLGDASYSIYLSHTIALSFFREIWRRLVPGAADPALFPLYFLTAMAVSTAAGVALYFVCERPLLTWMRRRRSTTRPATVLVDPAPSTAN